MLCHLSKWYIQYTVNIIYLFTKTLNATYNIGPWQKHSTCLYSCYTLHFDRFTFLFQSAPPQLDLFRSASFILFVLDCYVYNLHFIGWNFILFRSLQHKRTPLNASTAVPSPSIQLDDIHRLDVENGLHSCDASFIYILQFFRHIDFLARHLLNIHEVKPRTILSWSQVT